MKKRPSKANVCESQLVRTVDMPSALVTTLLNGAAGEPVEIALPVGISVSSN